MILCSCGSKKTGIVSSVLSKLNWVDKWEKEATGRHFGGFGPDAIKVGRLTFSPCDIEQEAISFTWLQQCNSFLQQECSHAFSEIKTLINPVRKRRSKTSDITFLIMGNYVSFNHIKKMITSPKALLSCRQYRFDIVQLQRDNLTICLDSEDGKCWYFPRDWDLRDHAQSFCKRFWPYVIMLSL